MNTGVPIRTRLNSHSADGICIRMQPCDSEWPIDHGSEVPWMPTPGALNPIQRVPSGLPGPGGTGLGPRGPRILRRWEPPRVPLLDDDLELAQRRRPRGLPGGDREDAHQVSAVVEVEAVQSSVDHDDRLGPGPRRPRASSPGRRSPRDRRSRPRRGSASASGTAAARGPDARAVKNGRLWRRRTLPATGARYVFFASAFTHFATRFVSSVGVSRMAVSTGAVSAVWTAESRPPSAVWK